MTTKKTLPEDDAGAEAEKLCGAAERVRECESNIHGLSWKERRSLEKEKNEEKLSEARVVIV
jgi:hypothetical protein